MADIKGLEIDSAPVGEKIEIFDVSGNSITAENVKNVVDTDLIRRAMEGDQKAFNELYMQSYRYVFFVIRRYISNDEIAYDAIQETFIKVYKGIKNLRSPNAFFGWISTIAKNTAIDVVRAFHYEVELSHEQNDDNLTAVQTNSDVSLDIETVLKKLSPDDAELLSLVYYDGMRVSQIAKISIRGLQSGVGSLIEEIKDRGCKYRGRFPV